MVNELLPVVPLDPDTSFVRKEFDPYTIGRIELGETFKNKDEVHIVVGVLCLKIVREVYPSRSDRQRLNFKCKHLDNCTFNVRATTGMRLRWTIHTYVPEHSCRREVDRIRRVNAHADTVATFMAGRIHDDGDLLKSRSIQFELQNDYGIQIKYNLTLKARNRALKLIYGSHEGSYQLVPEYLFMLRECNPGTCIDWDVDEEGRFRNCFVALWESICAYHTRKLRPVIVIDGTHLKEKGRGILFIAATNDRNGKLFPLAYGVGPKENDKSWGWLLRYFVDAFGNNGPLLVVLINISLLQML